MALSCLSSVVCAQFCVLHLNCLPTDVWGSMSYPSSSLWPDGLVCLSLRCCCREPKETLMDVKDAWAHLLE